MKMTQQHDVVQLLTVWHTTGHFTFLSQSSFMYYTRILSMGIK